MVSHVVVGGRVARDPEAVLEGYRPSPATVPPEVWEVVRPLALRSVRSAGYQSAWGAHNAVRAVAQFLAWATGQGIPLDPECVFTPDHTERFIATLTTSKYVKANARGALRQVGRTVTVRAPWSPPAPQYSDHRHLLPPYSDEEVAGFWRAARTQATPRRGWAMSGMLTLGLGAGLKVDEALSVTAKDHVRVHPTNQELWVIQLSDRVIPVRTECLPELKRLCREHPEGPLMGSVKRTAKDPLHNLRRNIETPAHLPPLTMSRLRTTWMAHVLSGDVRVSEFMLMAGTVSSKSLECIAPWVPVRTDDETYLARGAGL